MIPRIVSSPTFCFAMDFVTKTWIVMFGLFAATLCCCCYLFIDFVLRIPLIAMYHLSTSFLWTVAFLVYSVTDHLPKHCIRRWMMNNVIYLLFLFNTRGYTKTAFKLFRFLFWGLYWVLIIQFSRTHKCVITVEKQKHLLGLTWCAYSLFGDVMNLSKKWQTV